MVIQRGGADAGLEAETSKNLTFGGVFQPTFGSDFGNLSLAVDYFRVEVNNGVSQLGQPRSSKGCYNGSRPEYCQFVSRDPYTGPGTGAAVADTKRTSTSPPTWSKASISCFGTIANSGRASWISGSRRSAPWIASPRPTRTRRRSTSPARSAIRNGREPVTSVTTSVRGTLAGASTTSRERTTTLP